MANFKEEGRQGTQWSEVEFLKNRFYNYLGGDMPTTIACKELADNCTDQICDGRTNKGYFEIGENFLSVTAVDGGNGISTKKTVRIDTEKESTFLYLAIAKLYNSTNYGDQSSDDSKTVGSNGVGTKCNNFLSNIFTAGKIACHPGNHKVENINVDNFVGNLDKESFRKTYENPNGAVYGYNFMHGSATINSVDAQKENDPKWIGINVPLFEGETEPYGYMVHADYDNSITGFEDPINCQWIKDYIKVRLENAEPKDSDIYFTFRYPEKSSEGVVTMKEVVFVRALDYKAFAKEHKEEIASGRYELLISWDDQVNAIVNNPEFSGEVFGPYHVGYFDMLFAKRPEILKDIQNVCQGSIVLNSKSIALPFDVAGQNVKMMCPVVWRLSAKRAKGLMYTDQTKRKVANKKTTPKPLNLENLEAQAKRIPELMAFLESEANAKFLKKQNSSLQSDFYWPASGGTTAREYFSEPFGKHPEYALEVFNRIKDDDAVIKYAEEKKINMNNVEKGISNKKIDSKTLKELVEMEMIYFDIKEEKFDKEFKILLIVEGHSASSGIRTSRNSSVIGVLALRGKILNVWNKTLANAMKSEIIKELVKVLQDESYSYYIACTDADADGSSITTLLLGAIVKFRGDIIKEGKFLNNVSPLYTFKDAKTRELLGWSNDKNDVEKYGGKGKVKIVVNKGLGSYDNAEIKRLVLNPSAGTEWEKIVYDKNTVKSLTMALESGGKELVYKEDENNEPVPFIA